MPMTLSEAVVHVTTKDERFKVGSATIFGTDQRIFTNAPPNLRALLEASSAIHAEAGGDYLVAGDDRWSFDAYCAEVRAVAKALETEFGIGHGDRVAIAMRNLPEFLILIMAIASLGAVAVFVNAWWTAKELSYGFEDSGATVVFADGLRAERIADFAESRGIRVIGVREAEASTSLKYSTLRDVHLGADWSQTEIAPEDDFAVMYSSGTTGFPKGVVQTHRGAISAVMTWLFSAVVEPLTRADATDASDNATDPSRVIAMIVTPLFHVTATHPLFLVSIPAGARVVLLDKWDAETAVRTIEREQVTRFVGVPTQTADLLETAARCKASLSSLDFIGSGGAKRPAAQVSSLAQAFPNAAIATGWGMTETNAIGINLSGQDYVDRPESAGRLLPPLQDMKIVNPDGHNLPKGEVGELVIKSAANMRCYLNKPEATAEVLQDGWLRTGDLARVDAEGFVYIIDRKKSIIIRGGENISCLDVEGALHQHPAVLEAGVFPVFDPRLGEAVGAGIHTRDDVTADEIADFLQQHLARFKIPAYIWLRDTPVPRGATDKIDRRALRTECLPIPDARGVCAPVDRS